MLLSSGGGLEVRLGRAPLVVIDTFVGDAVEEREELIVLPLREGIEFVVVTAGALQRQPHQNGRRRVDAIGHVFDAILLVDDAPFGRQHVVAVEAGGDSLFESRVFQQVARELFRHKTVERHVRVERANHPVAPGPHRPFFVIVIAIGIGVTGRIEPLHGQPLAIPRRVEQAVDHFLVGIGGFVGQEGVEFGQRRRQSHQVEADAPQQRPLVGFGRGGQADGLQPLQHKIVNRVSRPDLVLDGRRRGAFWRDERPMLGEFGSLFDPQPEQFLLFGRQRFL